MIYIDTLHLVATLLVEDFCQDKTTIHVTLRCPDLASKISCRFMSYVCNMYIDTRPSFL